MYLEGFDVLVLSSESLLVLKVMSRAVLRFKAEFFDFSTFLL
jgi:hypothetical protein